MVSILLATYNGEKYIKESIDSIINQTFTDWELLIGFNGTTDNSKYIVNSYNDTRIRIFDYGDNKGKAKTLNKLLIETKYDLIAIQDDDDIWLEKKLENQINFIHKYDIIGTMISYIDENGLYCGTTNLCKNNDEITTMIITGHNQIANSSVLFKKNDIINIGKWCENLDILCEKDYQPLEDYEIWLRLAKNGKKFFNLNEKLVLHRIHSNSNFNNKKYDLNKVLEYANKF
jgi:glycosyltransferase involved in cell wall biosynthesis